MSASALETARAIVDGALTTETAVNDAVAAARADTTNAFTVVDERTSARIDEIQTLLDRQEEVGPLAGVPIAVKDLFDHAGRVTTAGSAFYRHQAATTAPAVEALEAAGAIVIGRTGLHEFAFGFSSENPWFGPVLNPWDRSLSPGGSSGGSAAAVAAGIVPLALGTDTGGSVRVPAALCSISGLKVTHGRIPLSGVFPLAPSLDTVGAIATTLDDLEVATAVMSDRLHPLGPAPTVTAPDLHLAVPWEWIEGWPLAAPVASSFQRFLDAAAAAGTTIEEIDLPPLRDRHHLASVMGPEVAAVHMDWREEGRPYGDDVGERIDAAIAVTADEGREGQAWRATWTASLRAVTESGAIVVTPTVAAMDKRIGDDLIGGRFYRPALSWFTAPVNQTGFPALSVPLAGEGRTCSVQLIGDRWGEDGLLAAARAYVSTGLLRDGRWSSDKAAD